MTVFEMIEAQQRGIENTAAWMVGEQLKDICRADPGCAAIVAEDLQQKEMSLAACEKKIKAYADKNKKGNSFCVIPTVAEDIIRKFYGLPERVQKGQETAEGPSRTPAPAEEASSLLDLGDLLGL